MGVTEMKLKAIEILASMRDEQSIKEIFDHLEKLDKEALTKNDIAEIFNDISLRYDDTMKKLAK
jgi:hypothetical protein